MTEIKKNVPIKRYINRHVILMTVQTTDPEGFMDNVKNSLAENDILQSYSIKDHSGFSDG